MKFLKSIFKGLFSEEISSLQKQVQSRQMALVEKEIIIKKIEQEKQQLASQIDSCHQDISNLGNQINLLKGNISAKNDDLLAKKQRIAALEKTLSEKKSEVERLKKCVCVDGHKIESLETANNDLWSLVRKQRSELEDNKERYQQLGNDLKLASEQIEKLTFQKSDLEIKLQESIQKLSDNQRVLSESENIIIEKSENLCAKDIELKGLNDYNSSLKEELNRLTGIVFKSRDQINILTSRNASLESDRNSILAKLNEIQSQPNDIELLNALKNEVRQKQETISVLESEIQQLNEENSVLNLKKRELDNQLTEKIRECEGLRKELQTISAQDEGVRDIELALKKAQTRITELENTLRNAPTLNELIKRDKEIERLKSKIWEYEKKVSETEVQQLPPQEPVSVPLNSSVPRGKVTEQVSKSRNTFRKLKFPYRKKPIAPSKDVVTVDFPVIENDNVYSQTARLIDKVFNHRSNSFITANEIFLHKSVEEISKMRFELEEATRTGLPYLTCPCCGNMVKISSRNVGFGSKSKEVQYFTHAVKNVPCDLKRDNSYTLAIDYGVNGENDFSYLKNLRNLLAESLRTELSLNKGISGVEDCTYINSDELPIMKRRLSDVSARYKDIDIVFEFVTPTTHVARVHDRDIFYLINRRQVFWIFGLESIVDYNELRRSVSKDIFFTNKRNVFVFDLEAQEESKRRGELILKCNWLDEDGDWYYQIDKNGKNGFLISLDQLHFEQDGCRPYFYDADEPYYLKHPTAERPLNLSREKLKEDVIEAWNYEQERKRAIEQMLRDNRGVEAYSDGENWGFKFGDTVFIEPIFDSKPIMLGDFAKIEKDGKFGVVNRYGDYCLKPEYDRVELLPNGYILYAAKDRWYLFGVIDPMTSFAMQDEVTVSSISKKASIYHLIIKKNLFKGQQPEEFYFVVNEIFKKNNISGKWGLWQSKGERITDISWDSLEFTSEDTIKVSLNGRSQLLALDGRIIEEQKYKYETKLNNGYSIVESFEEYWGLIDSNNIEIVLPIYDAIIPLNENFLKFKKGHLWGIITSTGKFIVAPIYHSVDGFDGENFAVTKHDDIRGWGYLSGKVDFSGKAVTEVVAQIESDTSITKSFGKFGIEKGGMVIIPHVYDSLFYWGEDKYTVQKDGKFGIIDAHNKVLLDFEYSSITPLKDGRSTITRGTSKNEIDNNLKIVEELVINLQEGYKKIKLGGKWGILNPEGQVMVECRYDEITTFRGRLIGIINGRLVKLNAYYPYRLPIKANNIGIVNSRDLVSSGNVKFQNIKRRNSPTKGEEAFVVLINWTYSMQFPMVLLYDKEKHIRRAKHVDKPTDFVVGDTFEAKVKLILKGYGVAKSKVKGVVIGLTNGRKSYIFKNDFIASGIDIATISIDDRFFVTKLGYDEELDRTQWRVRKIE